MKQAGAEYIFDAESGIKKKVVLNPRGACGTLLNSVMLVFFASLAVLGIWLTRYLANSTFTFDIDPEEEGFTKEKNKQQLWGWFCVFAYSLWASLLSNYITPAVEYLVKIENHKELAEADNSRIQKTFFLSCTISYAGLFYYQYVERSYSYLCLLMICLQVFN